MTPRTRLYIGALTTVLFLSVGAMLIVDGQTTLGGALAGLGALRGVLLWVQWRGEQG